jgi:two-component system, chemotaxis family, chemotaxis protein CheY
MSSLRPFTNRPPIRILIAERFLEAQARLEKLLSETKDMVSVGIAARGQEAITLAAEFHPAILLLDIDLPGGAMSTIKKIRHRSPTVQIIVLGYTGQPEDEQRAKKAGAAAYLGKPFSDEALLALIRSLHHAKTQGPSLLRRMEHKGGSYADLHNRMRKSMVESGVKQKIHSLLGNAFEQLLVEERIVLTRPERTRLFKRIEKEILQEMLDE